MTIENQNRIKELEAQLAEAERRAEGDAARIVALEAVLAAAVECIRREFDWEIEYWKDSPDSPYCVPAVKVYWQAKSALRAEGDAE